MLKISMDYDGTLTNTMELWCKKYNTLYNKNIGINDIKKWDFYTDFGLSDSQAFEIFDLVWLNWKDLKPLEKDQGKTIGKMTINNTVDLVTSVRDKHYNHVKNWLIENGIPYNDLVFSSHKYELDYDIFIDDSPINARKVDEKGKTCLLYHQEWNKDVSGSNIKRVYSLEEAREYIDKR